MPQTHSNDHGAWHLASYSTAYQPVRSNNFRFIVYGLDNLLTVKGDPNDSADVIKNAQEILDFSVIKFTPPHFSQDEIQVSRGNSKIYYAGVPSWNTSDLVINDFVGADGKSVLEAWQNLSYNVADDTIPSSDKYKVNCDVLEYLPDHTLIRAWHLYGCWVKGISEDGYDAENGGKKTVSATIRYDKAVPELSDRISNRFVAARDYNDYK